MAGERSFFDFLDPAGDRAAGSRAVVPVTPPAGQQPAAVAKPGDNALALGKILAATGKQIVDQKTAARDNILQFRDKIAGAQETAAAALRRRQEALTMNPLIRRLVGRFDSDLDIDKQNQIIQTSGAQVNAAVQRLSIDNQLVAGELDILASQQNTARGVFQTSVAAATEKRAQAGDVRADIASRLSQEAGARAVANQVEVGRQRKLVGLDLSAERRRIEEGIPTVFTEQELKAEDQRRQALDLQLRGAQNAIKLNELQVASTFKKAAINSMSVPELEELNKSIDKDGKANIIFRGEQIELNGSEIRSVLAAKSAGLRTTAEAATTAAIRNLTVANAAARGANIVIGATSLNNGIPPPEMVDTLTGLRATAAIVQQTGAASKEVADATQKVVDELAGNFKKTFIDTLPSEQQPAAVQFANSGTVSQSNAIAAGASAAAGVNLVPISHPLASVFAVINDVYTTNLNDSAFLSIDPEGLSDDEAINIPLRAQKRRQIFENSIRDKRVQSALTGNITQQGLILNLQQLAEQNQAAGAPNPWAKYLNTNGTGLNPKYSPVELVDGQPVQKFKLSNFMLDLMRDTVALREAGNDINLVDILYDQSFNPQSINLLNQKVQNSVGGNFEQIVIFQSMIGPLGSEASPFLKVMQGVRGKTIPQIIAQLQQNQQSAEPQPGQFIQISPEQAAKSQQVRDQAERSRQERLFGTTVKVPTDQSQNTIQDVFGDN